MKYGELKTKLKKGQISQLYLLNGEEGYYIKKAEEAILAAIFPAGARVEDVQIVDGRTSISDLIAMVETVPFFSEKNVIVVRDAAMFKSKKKAAAGDAEEEEPSEELESHDAALEGLLAELFANMPEFSIVIFELRGKADKRKKLYKELASHGQVMEAEPIKSYGIDDWLQGKLQEIHKRMDGEAHSYFVQIVEMMNDVSIGFLDKEMDKLDLFLGNDRRDITKEVLVQAFSDIPEVDGFAMNKAIGQLDVKKALRLYNKQQEEGTYINMIIGQLAYFVRRTWKVKALMNKGMGERAVGQTLKMGSYQVRETMRECRNFSEDTLKRALLQLAEADLDTKTGHCHPAAIEAIIIGLCQGNRE